MWFQVFLSITNIYMIARNYAYLIVVIFIIKGFQTIVFIFIVISTTFLELGNLQTISFIESTGVVCSDSVNHKRVQVLSIPVLLLACSQDWTCNL